MKSHFLSVLVAALVLMASMQARAAEQATTLPANEKEAKARLEKSPRHGEFVKITVAEGKPQLNSYIVYPERADKAPVVIVIHEIFGLSDWVKAVADQLAADGFIAIAPDMLSGHGKDGGGTESYATRNDVVAAIGGVKDPEVLADLNATRDYALKLTAANGKIATIGFCWGGGKSFLYAASQPELNAAAVYYGTPPNEEGLAKIKAPVAGFYGGNDNRVTGTVAPTVEKMKALGKPYSPHIYDGAGHGFLRQSDTPEANTKAAQQAWPSTLAFLRENTEVKKDEKK